MNNEILSGDFIELIAAKIKEQFRSKEDSLLQMFRGGKPGQVLIKTGDGDYEFQWIDLPLAGPQMPGVVYVDREIIDGANVLSIDNTPRGE